jgi:hypothetical protein
MIRRMEKENRNGLTVINILVNGRIISDTEKGSTFGKMVKST